MLHTQERETVEITVVNVNIKQAIAASATELERLQGLRTKANHKRKPAYQAKIDAHFGLK
jgi:hypothetical protein